MTLLAFADRLARCHPLNHAHRPLRNAYHTSRLIFLLQVHLSFSRAFWVSRHRGLSHLDVSFTLSSLLSHFGLALSTIHRVIILAGVRPVDKVVSEHDQSDTSHDAA